MAKYCVSGTNIIDYMHHHHQKMPLVPAKCVCNNVAKILIPPVGSLESLKPLRSEKTPG